VAILSRNPTGALYVRTKIRVVPHALAPRYLQLSKKRWGQIRANPTCTKPKYKILRHNSRVRDIDTNVKSRNPIAIGESQCVPVLRRFYQCIDNY